MAPFLFFGGGADFSRTRGVLAPPPPAKKKKNATKNDQFPPRLLAEECVEIICCKDFMCITSKNSREINFVILAFGMVEINQMAASLPLGDPVLTFSPRIR